MFTADIMTTYGVCAAAADFAGAVTSVYSFVDDIGARWAVYEIGIDIPSAVELVSSLGRFESTNVSGTA